MSSRACTQMLIVSSNGSAVNRLFIFKEHVYVLLLNVPSFAKLAIKNESLTQKAGYLSEIGFNSYDRCYASLCCAEPIIVRTGRRAQFFLWVLLTLFKISKE